MDENHVFEGVRLLESGQMMEVIIKVQLGEWTEDEANEAVQRYSGARPAVRRLVA